MESLFEKIGGEAVIELLGVTLQELGVADDLIQEVAAIGESTRNDVLNR